MDPTTNRLTSGYDANGNMLTGVGATLTYDGRNRMASASPTSGGTEYYGYAPDNKRIYRWNPTTGTEEWTFYGAKGERIGSFALNTSGTYYFSATETSLWFAGQLISNANGFVFRDRLGSNRGTGAEYYPYGDEITSTANGAEKYGTYVRDSFTALDYADQRYYASSYGRFNTADQYMASAGPKDPGSWNRYSYTRGDPVNNGDPSGQNDISCSTGCGGGIDLGIIFQVTVTATAPSQPGASLCVVMPNACSPIENGFTLGRVPPGGWPTTGGNAQAFNTWDALSPECQQGLKTAMPGGNAIQMVAALTRAYAAESTLQAATANTSIDWTMLAAIGIRETGFNNKLQVCPPGVAWGVPSCNGAGIFQLTVAGSLTVQQASDTTWAANSAAQMLNSNMATLAAKFPNFTPDQLLQATAASYNFGTSQISDNPATIDWGTAPGGALGNYGSNVVNLMDCFH